MYGSRGLGNSAGVDGVGRMAIGVAIRTIQSSRPRLVMEAEGSIQIISAVYPMILCHNAPVVTPR